MLRELKEGWLLSSYGLNFLWEEVVDFYWAVRSLDTLRDAFNDVDRLLGACFFKGLLESGCYRYKGFSALFIGECYRLSG